MDRENLGKEVRKVWIEWAKEQPNPKPHWLTPWEELSESDKEVDRRIGERLAAIVAKEFFDALPDEHNMTEAEKANFQEIIDAVAGGSDSGDGGTT